MKGTRVLLIFAVFWSAITLVFDVFCARSLIGQWRSERFAAGSGRILSSEVTRNSDGDGTTYGAKVRYRYRVGNQAYESETVRFGQMSSSDDDWARETVAAFPAGADCTVYYDPRDPASAVLQRGISGQELFFALFLTPFNVVMIMIWGALLTGWRRPPVAGGAVVTVLNDRIEVRFVKFPPAGVGLMAAGGLAFALIFVVGFSSGFSPPLPLMIGCWSAVLAAGLAAFFWNRRNFGGQRPDLVIDAAQGTVAVLPAAPKATATPTWKEWRRPLARTPVVAPLNRIRGVEVRERITDNGDGQSQTHVAALLVATDNPGAPEEIDVGSWMFPAGAESFVRWLRETLGLSGDRPAARP
jgi:hypothetical protein